MELMAAIKGLEAIDAAKEATIYSDSTYLVNTMTRGWKRRANHDLWEQLDRLALDHQITWQWVPSHSGIPGNEMADRLASMEARLSQREDAPISRKP
jgi:ribonuclease HI